jgi:type IV pilus assembly protein PilY1
MLHGFQAADGTEVFAFIPGSVFGNLTKLTNKNYAHQYFVDGSPNMGDVFYASAWHTVLVGGLNAGGQGIYALNVTNPSVLTSAETSPSGVVLWEFTDSNDSDLGYTFSQPAIVKLHNGKWAAVFGNGYNNTTSDGHASTTGNAALYIVDIETGALITKISTGAGMSADPTMASRSNGLATPAVVDLNGDDVVDYAYAGDLFGNLWKFNLTSTDPTQWSVAYKDSSNVLQPLFKARDTSGNAQPITERPEVIRGPNGAGMMVLFGTGKYLEPIDKQLTPRRDQTFYSIWDRNIGTASTDQVNSDRSALQQQTILAELSVNASTKVRVTSDNPMGASGWYLDLVSPSGYQAEKSIANPVARNGRIVFTTMIPDSDPCNFGGESWIMELDALSGSRLASSPFDVNRDGKIDKSDFVVITNPDGTTTKLPVSGIQYDNGMVGEPSILAAPNKDLEFKYNSGTAGGNISVLGEDPGPGGVGRQSWRQIR